MNVDLVCQVLGWTVCEQELIQYSWQREPCYYHCLTHCTMALTPEEPSEVVPSLGLIWCNLSPLAFLLPMLGVMCRNWEAQPSNFIYYE